MWRALAATLLVAAGGPTGAPARAQGYAEAPRTVHVLGLTATIRLGAADTDGRAGVIDFVVPANGGPPAHRHSREDEIFVIQKGAYRFLMDGVCVTAGPGDRVFLPKGHIHQYRNASDGPAEHSLVVMPAGLEQSFVDMEAEGIEVPRDFQRLNRLSIERYGLEFFPGHDFHAPACRPVTPVR